MIRYIVILLRLSSCTSLPKGSGISMSKGSVSKGELENGRRFPKKANNYKYFSTISYALFNRAWVHSKVLDITIQAYEELEKTYPERKFLIMECSKKHGGRIRPHRTHQNGTSIDFGVPLLRKEKITNRHHAFGLLHYAMRFDENGALKSNKNVKIDFETMAQHILALDKYARKKGMYVQKVILKINLKDDFYNTKSGKLVKKKKIYFAMNLPKLVDNIHDDHYHIDFGFL